MLTAPFSTTCQTSTLSGEDFFPIPVLIPFPTPFSVPIPVPIFTANNSFWCRMAPVSQSSETISLTPALIPPLWLLVGASLTTTRSRITAPLTLLTLCLALHPIIHNLHHASATTSNSHHDLFLDTLIRQPQPPPAPTVTPLPTGPLAPTPTPTTSPTPSPSVQLPPPPQQPVPLPEPFSDKLTLDECSGGLKRMQVILLLELCFEILFLFLRCFADQEETGDEPPVDVTMRGYIFMRAIYLVPVLGFNAGIYWVGGGPTGRCLSDFSAIQIPFVHLIFYALYCIVIVIIGVYRIDQYDKSTSYYDTESPTHRSTGPPTRTTSYFRSYGGRRRYNSESTSYEEPKFRINLGCCRLNF